MLFYVYERKIFFALSHTKQTLNFMCMYEYNKDNFQGSTRSFVPYKKTKAGAPLYDGTIYSTCALVLSASSVKKNWAMTAYAGELIYSTPLGRLVHFCLQRTAPASILAAHCFAGRCKKQGKIWF